ncbi:MAG: hypothetical protein J6I50_05170 [Clostridia bacterium]|nr:hypothetical protein [Clostridia bacterium]
MCSKEPIYTDDGDIWFYRSCDDPSHPDGCQIKESFCYTNHACVGCEAHYFNSDVLTHVESSEHTLGGDAVTECDYPVVYPPEHHH